MRREVVIRVALVALALVVAVGVDVLVDYPVPGRMAVVALASSFVLVLGAKWVAGAGLQRPIGTRPGELGDPADDMARDGVSDGVPRDLPEADRA